MKKLVLAALLSLVPSYIFAASIVVNPVFHVDDDDGNPLAGGCVYTYDCGGSTKHATCANATCSSDNANPIELDSRGEADIYTDQCIKVRVFPAEDDNVCDANPPGSTPIIEKDLLYGMGGIPPADGISLSATYSNNIAAAITAIGVTETTLVCDDTFTVASGTTATLNTNTVWDVRTGCNAGGVAGGGVETLALHKVINPANIDFIGSDLTVTVDEESNPMPEWMTENTTPGTTDMGPAIQWVLTNSNKLSLVPGQTYYTTVPITSQKADLVIEMNGAVITGTDVAGYILDLGNQASPTVGLHIDDLKVSALGTTTGALRISDIANFKVNLNRLYPTGIGVLVRGGCYLGEIHGGRIENQADGLDTAVKIEASTSGAKPNGMKLSNVWMAGTSKAGSKGFWDSAGGGAGMRSDNCYYEDFADNGVLVESGFNFEAIGDSFEGDTIGIQVDTNKPTILYPTISGGTTGIKVSGTSATLKYVSGPVDPSSEYAYIVDGASASIDTDYPTKVTIENPDNSINFNSTTRNFYPTKHTADTQLGFYHFSPGWTHSNKGALAIVTLTLPVIDNDSEYGMKSTFTRYNATYAMRIDPGAGTIYLDGVSLGAGKYASLDTNLAVVGVQSIAAGVWAMTTLNGTVTGEP